MWGSVLGFACLAALNPVRLGLVLLMISRPRPLQNLFAYWLGSITVCLFDLLVPLLALRFVPWFRSLHEYLANPDRGSAVPQFQIYFAIFVLALTSLLTVRYLVRKRAREAVVVGGAPVEANTSSRGIPILRLLDPPEDAPVRGRHHYPNPNSLPRRLLNRARNAWENGSLWIAFFIGFWTVPLDGAMFVIAMIATSGVGLGTQIGGAIAFTLIMYAAAEIILVSYLLTPQKTEALLRRLHDWVIGHRTQLFLSICALVGVSMLIQGLIRL